MEHITSPAMGRGTVAWSDIIGPDDVAKLLGVPRGTLAAWQNRGLAGRPFPAPARTISRVPLWDVATIKAWADTSDKLPDDARGPGAESLRLARADLADVRSNVLDAIAATADNARGTLDRADATRLHFPGEGGSWDWWHALDPKEQQRLRRTWIARKGDDTADGPDQLVMRLAPLLGLDTLDHDATMTTWVGLTRQVDMGRSLARSRAYVPRSAGFGGQGADDVFPDTGYDLARLLGGGGAAYLAEVRQLDATDAEDVRLRAPVLGAHPADLGYDAWAAEVADLTARTNAILERADEFGDAADAPLFDRLAELLPHPIVLALDEHPEWTQPDTYVAVVALYAAAS